MAGEIIINTSLQVSKGNLQFSYTPGVILVDMTGQGGPSPGFVTIDDSSEVEIDFDELGTAGMVMMRNLDTENYVRWGFATGVYGGRINPGETAGPFRLNPGASLFLLADTDPVPMLIYGFES